MTQLIVAFAGISGVGKTTFLRQLSALLDFQHLTAGTLIAAARSLDNRSRDFIRLADTDLNQRLLIEGFMSARDPNARLVILDSHMLIDTGDDIRRIPIEVFGALGVDTVIHLEAEPKQICTNRCRDKDRTRPIYPTHILGEHQRLSRSHAQTVADALRVPLHVVVHDDAIDLAATLTTMIRDKAEADCPPSSTQS